MKDHDELFDAYVAELREAVEQAERWWNELLAEESSRTFEASSGGSAVRERWPFGVVSHPRIIGVYRKYFLLCDELNRRIEAEMEAPDATPAREEEWGEPSDDDAQIVLPRSFVIDRLEGGENEDLHELMLSMVFNPVGLRDGEFV